MGLVGLWYPIVLPIVVIELLVLVKEVKAEMEEQMEEEMENEAEENCFSNRRREKVGVRSRRRPGVVYSPQ